VFFTHAKARRTPNNWQLHLDRMEGHITKKKLLNTLQDAEET
jgi:hypothetical protein